MCDSLGRLISMERVNSSGRTVGKSGDETFATHSYSPTSDTSNGMNSNLHAWCIVSKNIDSELHIAVN